MARFSYSFKLLAEFVRFARENKTYSCSSVGIHFSCGVLDIVVLFKHTQENELEELS